MKVRISFTVDVDPEAWEMNYGVSGGAAIREDAKTKARYDITEHWGPSGLDLLTPED